MAVTINDYSVIHQLKRLDSYDLLDPETRRHLDLLGYGDAIWWAYDNPALYIRGKEEGFIYQFTMTEDAAQQ